MYANQQGPQPTGFMDDIVIRVIIMVIIMVIILILTILFHK